MRLNLKKLLGNILFAAFLLLIFGRFLSIIAGTPFPMSVVTSRSMSPALFEGDVLPWIPCGMNDVHEGDIIVYKSASSWGNVMISHRVVGEREVDGRVAFVTKGDANNYTDQSGPHIPEPFVNEKMLEGKAIMFGRQPLKIPFAGYPWLGIQHAFTSLSKPMTWGKPQSDVHYAVFAPAAVSFAILFAGIVIWAPENGKSLKEKLREHIFGPERLSVKRIFAYTLLFYLVFLMVASSFSYDKLSCSVGVNETPPKSNIFFGNMAEGHDSFPKSLSIVNPSLLPVRGIIFSSGNISSFLVQKSGQFTLKSGGHFSGNTTASIPSGAKTGIYTGDIYIYSSPYWMLLPSSLVNPVLHWNAKGAVAAFSLISAVVMAVLTSILLIVVSMLIEQYLLAKRYISWKMLPIHARMHSLYGILHSLLSAGGRTRRKFTNAFRWMNGELHWVEFGIKKPFIASVAGFVATAPLIYLSGNFVYLLFVSSFIAGAVAYAAGCRWRAEVMFSAILVDAWFSAVLGIRAFYSIFWINHSMLVPFSSAVTIAGILMLIFAIMAVPACLLSWLPGYTIHSVREKFDYGVVLKRCDL